MDDIRLTVSNISPLIVSVNETWLHNNIDDNLISIPNYRVFRHDRSHKLGGGVAVWVHNSVHCSLIDLTVVPCDINCVVLLLPVSKLIFVSLYINPQTSTNASMCADVSSFLVHTIDYCLLSNPDFDIIICGDLNRFKVTSLCSSLDLINKVMNPTHNDAILDYFLTSSSIQHLFNVTVESPIANSDHRSLLCIPTDVVKSRLSIKRLLYDLRDSHVANFVAAVNCIDWKLLMCDDYDVNN